MQQALKLYIDDISMEHISETVTHSPCCPLNATFNPFGLSMANCADLLNLSLGIKSGQIKMQVTP